MYMLPTRTYPLGFNQIDVALALGWFILRGTHFVRRPKDSGLGSKPRIPIDLLPEPNCSNSCPDITANRVDRLTDSSQYHSAIAPTYLPPIGF